MTWLLHKAVVKKKRIHLANALFVDTSPLKHISIKTVPIS